MKLKNICIIGAGISGLAAADKLMRNNFDVTLIEAKDYVGGRIKVNHNLGIPISCGAAYVHGVKGNPIYDLVVQEKMALASFDDKPAIVVKHNGNQFTANEVAHAYKRFDELLRLSKETSKNINQDIPLSQSLDALVKVGMSHLDSDLFQWEKTYLSVFTGVEADYLSAKNWDQSCELEGGNHLLLSSYEPLINKLSENKNIRLSTVVKKINYHSREIKVETNNGSIDADAVIVTASLGVLQSGSISFYPNLPNDKSNSLNRLKMSLLNKIFFLFPKRFWKNDFVTLGYIGKHITDIPLFINYAYFFDKPILSCAVFGLSAYEFERMGKDLFIESALRTLSQIFKSNIPDPISVITTDWLADPYTKGSYSYIPVGADGADFDAIAAPVADRIFFAGEATSRRYHSTVHGAYLSGIREAERIISMCSR